MIKKSPNRWSVAPLVLLRTSNLPFSVFEDLKYERTVKNFEIKLNDGVANVVWSGDEIEDFDIDEREIKKKILTIIGDRKFWYIHYPFYFKHGPRILNDESSFLDFPQNKFRTDDYNLFYKRIAHMATKHNFSFNLNTCMPGQFDSDRSVNIRVPKRFSRGEKKVLLECWAQETLKNKLGREVNLVWKKRRYFFRPASPLLKPLESALNRFASAKSPKRERHLFDRCQAIFYELTGPPPKRQSKRFRDIVSFIRVYKKGVIVGQDLALQLRTVADSLGALLESFSYASGKIFLYLIRQGISPEKALSKAVSQGMSSLSLDFKGPAQGFFFGFDFMLCASSTKDINKGNYEIVLSDINIFPGGFEIFLDDKDASGKLAKKTVQLLVESMISLTDKKSAGISLLHDSGAMKNNQRWRERIKALVNCLHDNKINLRQMSYYPICKRHLSQSPASAFWFIRQGFFSSVSKEAMIGIEGNVFNRFFLAYAIQHRETLNNVIKKLKSSLPAIPIKTREWVVLSIDNFLDLFCHKNCFFKSQTSLSDWFACFRFFHHKEIGPLFFLKTEETKRFAPLCINLNNFYSFRILISSLRKMKKLGIREVIAEKMVPAQSNFWLKRTSENFPCEIRTFIVKSPIVN